MMLAVGTIGFILIHLAPGDPVLALSGEFADEAVERELRETYGLDRSLPEQYFRYLSRLARLDFGTSYVFQAPVTRVILERLPVTLQLAAPSFVLATAIGIALGLALARRRSGRARAVLAAVVASNAVPVFWLAQLFLLAFAMYLGWFPVQGIESARSSATGLARLADRASHLALPLAVMTLHQLALIAVLVWTGTERELGSEYVRAAEARGLSPRRVLLHAFRNNLPSLVTALGGRVGAIFSGAVLTETVFAWPGLGRLAVLASTSRDYPLVLGLFLAMTLSVLVANLLADLAYALCDPRIRHR